MAESPSTDGSGNVARAKVQKCASHIQNKQPDGRSAANVVARFISSFSGESVVKLGELLKMAREIKGVTLRDLERETGISNALLSQIETGHVRSPGFHNVVKIARALNVKLDTLADHAVTDLRKVLRDLKGK